MIETSDTSKLDESKKTETEKNNDNYKNAKDFISSTLNSGLWLIIYLAISFFIIYACKITETGSVLPVDLDYYPYTNKKRKIVKETDIFTNFPFSIPYFYEAGERKSLKILFEQGYYLDRAISYFRKLKEQKDASVYTIFICSIIISVFNWNFFVCENIFKFIDWSLAEFLLVIFGHYIFGILLAIFTALNGAFIVFFWIYNLSWMLTKRKCEGNLRKTLTLYEWFDYFIGIILICILLCILFTIIIPLILPLGTIITAVTLLSFLPCSARLKTKDDYTSNNLGKPKTFFDLFWQFLKYNKAIIILMFTFKVISHANTYFGSTVAGVAALIIFIMFYRKTIDISVHENDDKRYEMGLFTNTLETNINNCNCDDEKETHDYSEIDNLTEYKQGQGQGQGQGQVLNVGPVVKKVENQGSSQQGPVTNPESAGKSVEESKTGQPSVETVETVEGQPSVQTVQPSVQTVEGQPSVQTVQPSAETVEGQPSVQTVQPSAETVEGQPSVQTVQPSVETVEGQPSVQTVQPSAETVQPSAETVQPSAETVQPSAETVQPSAETVQPSAETEKKDVQKGGKKNKNQNIDSDNFMEELQKFNKKYSKFLKK